MFFTQSVNAVFMYVYLTGSYYYDRDDSKLNMRVTGIILLYKGKQENNYYFMSQFIADRNLLRFFFVRICGGKHTSPACASDSSKMERWLSWSMLEKKRLHCFSKLGKS